MLNQKHILVLRLNLTFKDGDHFRISMCNIYVFKGLQTKLDRKSICDFKKLKIHPYICAPPWMYVIKNLNDKETCKRQINLNFEIKKAIKKKDDSFILNGKFMIIDSIVGLIKMIIYKNESIFS